MYGVAERSPVLHTKLELRRLGMLVIFFFQTKCIYSMRLSIASSSEKHFLLEVNIFLVLAGIFATP